MDAAGPEHAQGHERPKLAKEADLLGRSRRTRTGKGEYTFVAETDLTGITGIRLEVLADARLPAERARARAEDGNFVLTEIELKRGAAGRNPSGRRRSSCRTRMADFSQEGFDVAKAIDGDPEADNGWAVFPYSASAHWATFEPKEPLGFEGGRC